MSSAKTSSTSAVLLVGVIIVAAVGFGGFPDKIPNFILPESDGKQEESVCVQASITRPSIITAQWNIGQHEGTRVYDGRDWDQCRDVEPGTLVSLRVKKHEPVTVTCRIYHADANRAIPRKVAEQTSHNMQDCRVEWVVS